MHNLIVAGPKDCLDRYAEILRELSDRYKLIEVPSEGELSAEMIAGINQYEKSSTSSLTVCDDRLLNHTRLSIAMQLRLAGFKPITYISPMAKIDKGVEIGENGLVFGGTYIGQGSRIGFSAFIGSGTHIGAGCKIDNGAFIESSCRIGSNVKIGGQATLTLGCLVQDGIKIGRQSYLGIPGLYDNDVIEKTYFHKRFKGPVKIFDFES